MQYELLPDIARVYIKKYGYHIYATNLIDRAGYNIVITNSILAEEYTISYSDYHSFTIANWSELLEGMCKKLQFRIEMMEIIDDK